MAQLTAVDWLITVIKHKRDLDLDEAEQTALEMQKEQMADMFLTGGRSAFNSVKGQTFQTFEDYYNETYGE